MNKHFLYLLTVFVVVGLQSCKVMYPNKMFKEGNYEYFSVSDETAKEYLIAEGDLLSLEVYARDGFELIDVLAGTEQKNTTESQRQNYLVNQDGFVELPLFGQMKVVGYTEKALENIIETKSAALFNEPYAVLKVVNRRAIVFKGSEASVISLNQGPTSILEVIAKSGGLSRDLKAYNIKILRGDLKNPEIIEIDLSTISGLQDADLTVQANDVIYVEERLRLAKGIISEVAPILSLTSSMATILILIKRN